MTRGRHFGVEGSGIGLVGEESREEVVWQLIT